MMLYLFAQDTPDPNMGFMNVLLWPTVLTLLGWGIFYGGWWIENRLTKAPWKWLAVIPIVIGAYIGFGFVMDIQNPVYNMYVSSSGGARKMMFAHYGALILPILGLVGLVLFHFYNHKLNLGQDD